MSQQTTTVSQTTPAPEAKKARRKLPPALSIEQFKALKKGDRVLARESGKVYEIVSEPSETGHPKGREIKDGKMAGPARPLSNSGVSAYEHPQADGAVEAVTGMTSEQVAEQNEAAQAAASEPEQVETPAAEVPADVAQTVQAIEQGNLADGVEVPLPAKQQPEPTLPKAAEQPVPQAEAEAQESEVKADETHGPVLYVYRLNGPNTRYEWLTADKAARRNAHRKQQKKDGLWTQIDERQVPKGVEILEPKDYTDDERRALSKAGHQKDEQWMEQRKQLVESKGRKVLTDTGKAEAEAPAGKSGEVKPAAKKAPAAGNRIVRPEWQGMGMCDLIRFGGSQGWDKKVIAQVCERVGFKPSPTTIHIQSKKGKDGEGVPTPDKSVANELAAFAAEFAGKPSDKAEGKMQVRSSGKAK